MLEYLSWASELVAGAPKMATYEGFDQKGRVKHRTPALRDDALIGYLGCLSPVSSSMGYLVQYLSGFVLLP